MNIRAELLREHSARQTKRLATYVCAHVTHLDELIAVVLHGTYRERQLAADIVGVVGEQQPAWLVPHLEPLLATALTVPGQHPAVGRGVMRALQFVTVPEEWQARAFDICLAVLLAPTEPIATKVSSLSAAARLVGPYPELAQELEAAAHWVLDATNSPAFRSRAARELPNLRAALREVFVS